MSAFDLTRHIVQFVDTAVTNINDAVSTTSSQKLSGMPSTSTISTSNFTTSSSSNSASASNRSHSKKKEGAGHWKSAVDSKSGRVYYYNSKTRETSWNKPFELCTPEEQTEMIRKREEAFKFFYEMEQNIILQFQQSQSQLPSQSKSSPTASSINSNKMDESYYYTLDDEMLVSGGVMFAGDSGKRDKIDYFGVNDVPFKDKPVNTTTNRARLTSASSMAAPRMIRTISTIDDDILEIMKYDERLKSSGIVKPGGSLTRGISNASSEERSPMEARRRGSNTSQSWYTSSPLLDTSSIDSKSSSFLLSKNNTSTQPSKSSLTNGIKTNPKPSLKRRNSTGTIYVGTTMSVQDNEATIKCVCVVIRAHIIEASKRNAVASKQYDIFKDPISPIGSGNYGHGNSNNSNNNNSPVPIPSLAEIKDFFMLVFSKSQLESECIIMALIYCERMIKETQGRFIVRHDNWKSILFACLVMASKVWDDLSMWNVDFSQISLSFNLQRVNALELAVLEALDYVIRVSASDYAKYYFHLRSMMARLGFHDNEPNYIAPLDINGARKLQLATERYQEDRQTVRQVQSMRLDSAQISSVLAGRLERHVSADGFEMANRLKHNVTVGLEQIVHSEHNDADGAAHTSAKNTPRHISSVTSPRAVVNNVVGFAHR